MDKTKKLCFFGFWMDMISQNVKKHKQYSRFFLAFQHVRFGFLHWKVSKTKNIWFFVFWYLDWSYPFKKTKNKQCVFFSVVPFQTRKKDGKQTKKNLFWVKTKHSPQNMFFWFLVSQASPRLLALFFCFSKLFAVLVIVILDIYILYKISEALMFT